MFNPIYPMGRRPLVVRTNADYKYTSVAVDQVIAADGNYQVLFLGTGTNVYTVYAKCCRSTLALTSTLVVMVPGHDGTTLMCFSHRGHLEFYPKKCFYAE